MVHFHPHRVAGAQDFIEALQADFATEFDELEAQTGETPPRAKSPRPLHRIEPAPRFNSVDRRKKRR